MPGSQSNLTMVPGVNWKVDLRPFDGVASAPHDTTAKHRNCHIALSIVEPFR